MPPPTCVEQRGLPPRATDGRPFGTGTGACPKGKGAEGGAALRQAAQQEKDPVRKKAFADRLAAIDKGEQTGKELSDEVFELRRGISRTPERRVLPEPGEQRKPFSVTVGYDDADGPPPRLGVY